MRWPAETARRRPGRPARWALLVAVALGAVACAPAGGPVAASGAAATAEGPRPAGQDPCGLLPPVQLDVFGVDRGTVEPATDSFGGVLCRWRTRTPEQGGGQYVARVLRGAAPGGTPSAPVNGLPTAEFAPPGLDRRTACIYLVGVASGQTLWAQYTDPSGGLPGLDHVVACNKAQQAAATMANTFGTLPG